MQYCNACRMRWDRQLPSSEVLTSLTRFINEGDVVPIKLFAQLSEIEQGA